MIITSNFPHSSSPPQDGLGQKPSTFKFECHLRLRLRRNRGYTFCFIFWLLTLLWQERIASSGCGIYPGSNLMLPQVSVVWTAVTKIILYGRGVNLNMTRAKSMLQYKGLSTSHIDPSKMDSDRNPQPSNPNGTFALRLGSRKKPWLYILFHFLITDALVTGTLVIPWCIMINISVGQCTRCAMSDR